MNQPRSSPADDAAVAPPAPAWQLRLQGRPVLLRHGGTAHGHVELPLARKDAALLAWVALDGPLPSAHVAAALWPDATATGGLNNLRQRLHRLRRSTGARLLEMTDT